MVSLAIKNIQIRPKGDGSYSDVLHPETNGGQVLYFDEGEDPDYIGIKYKLVVIDGQPYLEVIES